MMNNDPTTLVQRNIGDIVADNYHAAGVFKEFGIDFCCGGGLPLGEVCERKGINPDQVTLKLSTMPTGGTTVNQKFNLWEPDFLIDYIINNHHTFVRTKTEEILVYAAKVANVHGERHPENIEIYQLFAKLSNELIQHLQDEEQTVFPLIKNIHLQIKNGEEVNEKLANQLRAELDHMIDDHEGAGDIMKEIRSLSNDFTPPADACATYQILYQNLAGFEEDLHQHVHLENNILFKKAETLLSDL
ncbi:iron-sulfur cluster repair di-iron protein [Rhodohalobacter barkolensis]|uniref:Iron-sulfur cluster repair di-iron protein n=1 Tax=Rhodohalobacter barkolensis TaxID=2053187 RepID=A0A2N0VJX2_9BACT|nr:iron-sulfur cluster repair di-iron protein [Rhodohalobacter barkolensis]PKD44444.1 iron-sulfur cluster repair di-iron protein [Rhodohalobacter barkolensis]